MSADGILEALLAIIGLAVVGLPGLALGWLLRGRRLADPIDGVIAAGATAIGIVVLGGLVLNLLPIGLAELSWLGLATVTAAVAAVVGIRRSRARSRQPRPSSIMDSRSARVSRLDAVGLGAAAVLVVAAVLVAGAGVHQPAEPYTQLWLVAGAGGGTTVGVESHEDAPVTYRVQVLAGGGIAATYDSIRLAPGQSWTTQLRLVLPSGSEAVARLYRSDAPTTVYREAGLWGPVGGS